MAKAKGNPSYVRVHTVRPERMSGDAYGHVVVSFCKVDLKDYRPDSDWTLGGFEQVIFTCQIDSRASRSEVSYAWAMGVGDGSFCHPCPFEKLEPAVKAMASMRKAATKAGETYGPATTFGAYVAQHIAKLGLDGFVEPSRERDEWRLRGMADLVYTIDTRCRELAAECRKASGRGEELPEVREAFAS